MIQTSRHKMVIGSWLGGVRGRAANIAICCHFGLALLEPIAGNDSHLVEQLKLPLIYLGLGGGVLIVAAAVGLPLELVGLIVQFFESEEDDAADGDGEFDITVCFLLSKSRITWSLE